MLGVFSHPYSYQPSACYRHAPKESSEIAIKTQPPVKPSQSQEEEERGNNCLYCLFRQLLPV
ncbi:hypothetical protein amyaer_3076 [Microcystis aeruginosa NIES-2481]|nr:hypothetical protein amyaer_3076 [Microcystis aeruginosa NIES-2481]